MVQGGFASQLHVDGHLHLTECDLCPNGYAVVFELYHSRESSEPDSTEGHNSLSKEQEELDALSPFGFISAVNETFGYSHEQTLNAPMAFILAMMRERGYILAKRNRDIKARSNSEDGELKEGEHWETVRDFETGKLKRVKALSPHAFANELRAQLEK